MKKVSLLILTLIFLVSSIFVSCSKNKNQQKTKSNESQQVQLRIWIMPNSSKPAEDLNEILKPFLEENPNIKVKVEVLDWGAAWTKITTAATSGDAPDLVQLGTTWTSLITGMNALLPLDDLAKEVGGESAFVKGLWTYAKPVFSKHVTSLPWIVDVRPLYYRKDVFEKVGIKLDDIKDWEGFKKALEKIKKANLVIDGQKVAPIGYPGKNDWNVVHNLAPWIWMAGGDIISEYGDSVLLDSPQTLKGVMYYISFVKDGLMPKDYLEKNTAQLSVEFDQGRIATWFEPTSKYIYLNKPPEQGGASNTIGAKNYGVALPPAGPAGRILFLGGSNLAIFKSTKHPEEAKKLLKFLTTDIDAQIGYFQKCGLLPAYKAAFNDPYFTDDPIRRVFKEMTEYGKAYPSVPYWAEIETSVLTVSFGDIFEYIKLTPNDKINKKDIAKILKDAANRIRNIIAKDLKEHPEHKAIIDSLKAAQQNKVEAKANTTKK